MAQPPDRPNRDGFGEGLLELARKDSRVVAITADLTSSMRLSAFQSAFPHRFWNVGIAEQHMVAMAAGLASEGYLPFIATYGSFFLRAVDQIRISICLNNLNVKLVSGHGGLAVGQDGGSAQVLEDVAVYRALPGMTVISPVDAVEVKKATIAMSEHQGPAVIRVARQSSRIITTSRDPFVIGRGEVLRQGTDCVVVGTGPVLVEALLASEALEKEGLSIGVVNIHTIKPIDSALLVEVAEQTGCVVTVEDHQVIGGLGSAVTEVLSERYPVPVERVGVMNRFGQSGSSAELWKDYGLDSTGIKRAVRRVLKRKKL